MQVTSNVPCECGYISYYLLTLHQYPVATNFPALVHPMLCNAVACPHLERSGMGTACSRSASAHLYHAGSRLLPCDGAAD